MAFDFSLYIMQSRHISSLTSYVELHAVSLSSAEMLESLSEEDESEDEDDPPSPSP
jgi:hypothetical protein